MTSLLAQLAYCRISHGDMKGTNFIQSPRGIAVIDLDAMREYRTDSGFRRAQQRDLQRFLRNWQPCPEIAALFKTSIEHLQRVAAI
jgi:tRNA A-37 threonylcarbamoyl transferase component Bud32